MQSSLSAIANIISRNLTKPVWEWKFPNAIFADLYICVLLIRIVIPEVLVAFVRGPRGHGVPREGSDGDAAIRAAKKESSLSQSDK